MFQIFKSSNSIHVIQTEEHGERNTWRFPSYQAAYKFVYGLKCPGNVMPNIINN